MKCCAVYSQIPEDWLDKALERLYDKVTPLYAKFSEFLNVFVVDGTGIPCDSLVERERMMKKRLAMFLLFIPSFLDGLKNKIESFIR